MIEGAKEALAEQAATVSQVNFSRGAFKWDADATRSRLQLFDNSHGANPVARHREMDLCQRWERDAALKTPTHIARQRAQFINLSEPDWEEKMSEIDAAAGATVSPSNMAARDRLYQRDQRLQQFKNDDIAHSWDAYEPRIDRPALNLFLQQRSVLCREAAALSDERTEDVVAWLLATALQDALLEFHGDDPLDGECFSNTIGNLIFGIESSPAGKSLIKKWVDSPHAGKENLLWRCFSLNHKDGIQSVNRILALAAANKQMPYSEKSIDVIKEVVKDFAKLSQLAQKGLALHNALRTDGVLRIRTGGIEKVLVSVGNFFLQPFIRRAIDTLAEGLIFGLLLARSGSQHLLIINLLMEQARSGTAVRAEMLAFLSIGQGVISNRFGATKEAWKALARDANIPKQNKNQDLAGGFNESKQLAFGMVATIFQTILVWKLYSDASKQPNNESLRYSLWAAGFSLGAGLADLCATGTKVVNGLSDKAITFQALKLGGGLLSAISASIVVVEDVRDFKMESAKGNDNIAILYFTKGGFDAVSGVVSILGALSYAEPALTMVAKNFPLTFFGRAAAAAPELGTVFAERFFITRALLLCTGIYLSIALIVIQILIWKYSDDALQHWCDRCAFGRKKSYRFGGSEIQMIAFKNLTKED